MDVASSEAQEQIVAAEILVSGRVQGVAYRAFAQNVARGLALCGWVRNLPDGRVQAEVEGPRGQVERLLEQLRQGPSLARVGGVSVIWKTPSGTSRNFMIID